MKAVNHVCAYHKCHKDQRKHKGISFFKFPLKDLERIEKWKENCGNPVIAGRYVDDLKNKIICERHFYPKDMNLSNVNKKLLRRNAIPIHWSEKVKFKHTMPPPQPKTPDLDTIKPFGAPPLRTYVRKKPAIVDTSAADELKVIEFIKCEPLEPGEEPLNSPSTSEINSTSNRSQFNILEFIKSENDDPVSLASSSHAPGSICTRENTLEVLEMKRKKLQEARRKRISKLAKNRRLRKKINAFSVTSTLNNLLLNKSQAVKTFVIMQCLSGARTVWTQAEQQLALCLYRKSPKSYNFMLNKLNFNLPSLRMIQTWIKLY